MSVYIEHDYYPMDDFKEFNPTEPRKCVLGRQAPATCPLLDQEKEGLQVMQAESVEVAKP